MRLLFRLSLATVLSLASLSVLRTFQLDRNADRLRAQALSQRRSGRADEATRILSHYLKLRSEDAEAQAELGLLLDEAARTERDRDRALKAYETALRLSAGNADQPLPVKGDLSRARAAEVRLRTIDLLLRPSSARYQDALRHARRLGGSPRLEFESLVRQGRAWRGLGRHFPAAVRYLMAIDRDPTRIEPYVELAEVVDLQPDVLSARARDGKWLRDQDIGAGRSLLPPEVRGDHLLDHADAAKQFNTKLLAAMIELAQPSERARLARAAYRRNQGLLQEAAHDLDVALTIAPQDAELLLAADDLAMARADAARSAGKPAAARELLEESRLRLGAGFDLNAHDVRFHLAMAKVEVFLAEDASDAERRTHYAAARQSLEDGLWRCDAAEAADGLLPESLQATAAQLRWWLAEVAISESEADGDETRRTQRLDEAKRYVESLMGTGLDRSLLAISRARLWRAEGRWNRAAAALEQARLGLRRWPEHARRVDLLLGECYDHLADPERRADVFRRALRDDPAWTRGRLQLAEALVDSNRISEAIAQYEFVDSAPHAALEIARLTVFEQAQRPADRRQWAAARRALDRARAAAGDAPELTILRAQVAVLEAESFSGR
ncbi:MAG TPA: hypothetical protein VML55_17275, partial [Planctomycetaceae bacterium]|nr:hypothetical protein [Planctomycetaceae bacterium]